MIEDYIGLICTHKLMNIDERYGHNGCIITMNNIPYFFIFSGYCDNKSSRLPDGYLINLI